MVEFFRVTVSLILAIHIALLGHLALTSNSSQCKTPAVAYVDIKSTVEVGNSKLSAIDMYSQTKPVCIGVMGTAQMNNFLSTSISSVVDDNLDNNEPKVQQLSSFALNSHLHLFKRQKNQKFVHAKINQIKGYPWANGDEKVCVPKNFAISPNTITPTYDDLNECENKTTNVKKDLNPISILQQGQGGFEICGDLVKTIAEYLSELCETSGGNNCDVNDIMKNIPSMCNRLEIAGIILASGFGVSILGLWTLLFFSQDSSDGKNTSILSFMYLVSFGLFLSSFIMYNLELFDDNTSAYFWTPIIKRLGGSFKEPIDNEFESLDSVNIVLGSSYYYLVTCIFLNLVLFILLVIANRTNRPFMSNISSKIDKNNEGVQKAMGSLFF